MPTVIRALDVSIEWLRSGFSVALLVAAGLAALAWAARTRRLNPFGALSRFSRQVIEPMIAPVERRTARFGGSHTSAPWWALLAFLVLGALLLGVLGFLRDVLVSTYFASSQGPRGVLRLAVSAVFAVLQLALIVRVVISWVGGSYSRIGRLAHTLTEWFLGPLRRVLPSIGMVDISPLVAYFALMLVRGFLLGVL
jgi:YggT family protein